MEEDIRNGLIGELVEKLDYSYAAERYGVKLLRTALTPLSDDTLLLLKVYLSESIDERRGIVTSVMSEGTEEELREVVVFGDYIGISDLDGVLTILDEMHDLPDFEGCDDFTKLDDDGYKEVIAMCRMEGVKYRMAREGRSDTGT